MPRQGDWCYRRPPTATRSLGSVPTRMLERSVGILSLCGYAGFVLFFALR